MRLSLIIIFALLLLIPDLYIWYFFLRKKKIGWVLLFFLPLIYTLMVLYGKGYKRRKLQSFFA